MKEKNKAEQIEQAKKFEQLKQLLSHEETPYEWETADGEFDSFSPKEFIDNYFKKKSEEKS